MDQHGAYASHRPVQARRRGYMVEDAVMAAHPDVPTAQKDIQRTEVGRRPFRDACGWLVTVGSAMHSCCQDDSEWTCRCRCIMAAGIVCFCCHLSRRSTVAGALRVCLNWRLRVSLFSKPYSRSLCFRADAACAGEAAGGAEGAAEEPCGGGGAAPGAVGRLAAQHARPAALCRHLRAALVRRLRMCQHWLSRVLQGNSC